MIRPGTSSTSKSVRRARCSRAKAFVLDEPSSMASRRSGESRPPDPSSASPEISNSGLFQPSSFAA
nr:hypothetical protein [Naasia aerilata]